jgi:hypothetical protein
MLLDIISKDGRKGHWKGERFVKKGLEIGPRMNADERGIESDWAGFGLKAE